MKKQNGITLIALIITIIVMLILVGVSVSIAINGGLIGNAKEATMESERRIIYEQIVSAMKLKTGGEINVKETYETAKNGLVQEGRNVVPTIPSAEAEITTDITRVTFDVTGKRGTYTYTITTKEILMGVGEVEDYGDFRIEVQTTELELAYKSTLQVRPILTEDIFTEGEASHIVAKEVFGNDQVTTLKQLIVVAVNNLVDGVNFGLDEYDELIVALKNQYPDADLSDEKKAFELLMQETNQDYEDVVEYAMDVTDKTLLIDGIEVTEVTWEEFSATCEINEVGSKEVQLKIDEKVGKKTITFETTDANLGSVREAVVKTWTDSDFLDFLFIIQEDNPDTQIDESKIEAVQHGCVIGYDEDCSELIKYENKVYAFEYSVNDNDEIVVDDIDLIYVKTGYEGTIVKYDYNGEGATDWMVMYDNTAEDGTVEIISMDAIAPYDLGYRNEEVQKNSTDLDANDKVDNIEIAIYTANNAIKLLNDYCDSLVTNQTKIGKARSVGSKPGDPYYENTNPISIPIGEIPSYILSSWPYGDVEGGDENYIQDVQRMQCLGCTADGNNRYFLASRVYNGSTNVLARIVTKTGYIEGTFNEPILYISDDAITVQSNINAYVRPVVTISSSTLNNLMSE